MAIVSNNVRPIIYDELQLHDKMRIHNFLIKKYIKKAIYNSKKYAVFDVSFLSFDITYINKNFTKKQFIKKVKTTMRTSSKEENLKGIIREIKRIDDTAYFVILVNVTMPRGSIFPYVYKIKKNKHIPYWIEKNILRSNNPYFSKHQLIEIYNFILSNDINILMYLTRINNGKEIMCIETDFSVNDLSVFIIRRAYIRRELQRRIADTDTIKMFKRINGEQIFILKVQNYLKVYVLYVRYLIDEIGIRCKPITNEEERKILIGEPLGEFTFER